MIAPIRDQPWTLTRWGLRDGLPQAQVFAICEGEFGELWIGTYGGLARFDGDSIRPVDPSRYPQLAAARISALLYDEERHRVYVGTEGQGLYAIEDGELLALNQRQRDWGGDVRAMSLNEDGSLWVGGRGGLYRLASDGDIVDKVEGFIGDVEDLHPTSAGSLWISAEFGLFRWQDGKLEQFSELNSKSVLLTSQGKVLSGDHHHQLLEIDPQSREFRIWDFGVELGGINDLLETADGTIWIGGRNPIMWDGERFEFALSRHQSSLVRNLPCETLFLDHESSIWFGGGGIHQLRPSVAWARTVPEFEQDTPRAVLIDPHEGDAVWVARVSGNITRLLGDRVTHTFNSTGRTLALGKDGEAYACMEGTGISRLDLDRTNEEGRCEVVVPAELIGPGMTHALLADPDDGWWVGADATLHYITSNLERTTFHPSKDLGVGGKIVRLAWSPEGDLWVGSESGVAVLRGNRVLRRFHNHDELSFGEVRAIHFRDTGYVWLGHYGGGISIVRPDGTVRPLNLQHGLHENVVSEIRVDPLGNLLLLGNRGISAIGREEVQAFERGARDQVFARIFDRSPCLMEFEGMGGAMPSSAIREDGMVLFPALQAVVSFSPEAIHQSLPAPEVRIASLSVGAQSTEQARHRIPSGERSIVARFDTRTFVDTELVRYRHRLLGLDERWSALTSNPVAHYSYLDLGRYELQVQARNRDGVWSEVVRSPALTFLPVWYEDPLYRTAGVCAIVGMIAMVVWGYFRSQRRVRLELEAEVRARTSQLEGHRERLQKDVTLRTRDLQQALHQLQADMAARERLAAELRRSERLQALGRFSGGIAHDFNNILTAILGDAELGASKTQENETRQRFSRIRSAGERASQLIRQILAFGGQAQTGSEPIDLNANIEKCVELIQAAIPESVQLRLDLMEPETQVRLDLSQLEQVLMNLVFNARDAITGPGLITVRTRQHDARRIAVEVIDDGEGIAEKDQHHIFDPFFTTKEPGKGTGLGLASVHGIVEQVGGEIVVESELGVGTRISVLLPTARPRVANNAAPVLTSPASPGKERPVVLLCDDEPEVLRVMTKALEEQDLELLIAHSPEEARTIAARFPRPIDYLITDVVMPGMNGDELAKRMQETNPDLTVAYLSGFSQRGISAAATLDPSVPFLAKPFLPSAFRSFVLDLVKLPSRERAEQGLR